MWAEVGRRGPFRASESGSGHLCAGTSREILDSDHLVLTQDAKNGAATRRYLVVETGVDPVTPRFSGVCSAN